ncbi:MAG: hypothetical protein K1Y02_25010, partial [Candidatus Hydrogenedentes bacterium]|nr:hypothetical protein [Candidatus Hydrogenedentota bacterium]
TGYSGGTLGRGNMSRNIVRNRKGYAGYEHDGILDNIMHVRHRVYESELGRWVQRDPLGFVDGGNVYGYGSATSQAC